MYKENYMEALRTELVEAVQKKLSPLALTYHYSDVPLEVNINWRPTVLILGNYSSGKSTLINELLGGNIQETGQAPTDDSFTVIARTEELHAGPVRVEEERDGNVLLHDKQYPFRLLKKHGERFSAHFRLKRVNSPFLDNLAIIDTPGMLDSSSERDRGYNYQEVIGDLAQIADLILVMFDPHKAGTVREAHLSLRETLPTRTFEDRVVFVLNRIDECSNLNDLLRVYGTLCWNLSQMTGRKDIPLIHLTYSENAAPSRAAEAKPFLSLLQNQRENLRQRILASPRYRLDNLASYIETHGERMEHMLEGLLRYGQLRLRFQIRYLLTAVIISLFAGGLTWLLSVNAEFLQNAGAPAAWIASAAVTVITMMTSIILLKATLLPSWHRQSLKSLGELTRKHTQARNDSWAAVEKTVAAYLKETKGKVRIRKLKQDLKAVRQAHQKASVDARDALAEMSNLPQHF